MKIERLEPSKHKQGRWLVWFDDGSLVRAGEGDVVSQSLYAGKEVQLVPDSPSSVPLGSVVPDHHSGIFPSKQSQVAAKAAGRAVDVSADDFEG